MIIVLDYIAGMIMRIALTILVFQALSAWNPMAAHAGGDPDRGMSRAWNIEEPWIENAYYLYASRDNNNAPGHGLSTSTEMDLSFSPRWGAEIDGPGIMANQPIGKGAKTMTPLAIGIKFAPWQWGSDDDNSAGIVDFEAEANWWPHPMPKDFPGTGPNMTEQILVGLRHNYRWFQGQYAITQRLGADARSGWSANNAVGERIGGIWSTQIELDLNHTSVDPSGRTTTGIAWIPQLCARIGQTWEAIIGESFARTGGQPGYTVTTNLLIEYRFDNDENTVP